MSSSTPSGSFDTRRMPDRRRKPLRSAQTFRTEQRFARRLVSSGGRSGERSNSTIWRTWAARATLAMSMRSDLQRMPRSFVVTFTAAILITVAGVASAFASSVPADDTGTCYSVLFPDGGPAARSPEVALKEAATWATTFVRSADSAHPYEADRLAAVASAASRATQVAATQDLVVYEARSSGRLDGRFEVVATPDGWVLSTVTVKAPRAFCTPSS